MLQPVHSGRVEPKGGRERFSGNLQSHNGISHGYWISRISELLGTERAGTLALAQVMHEARQGLRRQWSALWRSGKIPMSKRQADKLVTIGREFGALNENNCAHLPLQRSVLYHLALLGRNTVVRLIAEGVIHPGLSLGEAMRLRQRKTRRDHASIERAIQRLEAMIQNGAEEISGSRRAGYAARLSRLSAEILKIGIIKGESHRICVIP